MQAGDKVEKVVVSDLCKVIKDVLGDKDENDRLSSARMRMIVCVFQEKKRICTEAESQEVVLPELAS